MTSEEVFISKIDCCFDYSNYKPLVEEAKGISGKCVEMIVYEVIFVPRSVSVELSKRIEILNYIDLPVSKTGLKILLKEPVSDQEKNLYPMLFND